MRGQITKPHLSRIKLDERSNHHFTLGRKSIKKRVRIGYCFAKVPFFSLNENIPTLRICLPSLRWERRTVADASVGFLEDGEGEGGSTKSEMMVASSVQLNAGKVGLCDLTPHHSFSTTAALRPGCLQFQPLLRTVIWCIARGTRRWMSHMSAEGVLLSVSPFRMRTDPA